MKRFIIAEICVIVALVVGFWFGRSTGSDKSYERYYENAENAWLKARKADNPPVTLDDPDQKRIRKVRALYRQVFEKYRDSRWSDDAIYELASRIARTDEEAFALFRRLIANYPDSEWADDSLYTIAIANYRTGETTKQMDSLESADLYYDRAFSLFNQLIHDYPGSSLVGESRFNRAMCYYGKGNWNQALDAFDALREDFRDNELIHSIVHYTGMILMEKQQYAQARVEFQNVVDSGHPELAPPAMFGIAQTFFAEGDFEKAIQQYQRTIDTYGNTMSGENAHFYMGWAYSELQKYDEAIAKLEEAIQNYPHNENASNSQFFIAQIYYANKDMDGAVNAYRKVADNDTFDYDTRRQAQYWIGHIYEQQENTNQAVTEYQRLLKDFPEPHQNPRHPSNNVNENYIQKLAKVSEL